MSYQAYQPVPGSQQQQPYYAQQNPFQPAAGQHDYTSQPYGSAAGTPTGGYKDYSAVHDEPAAPANPSAYNYPKRSNKRRVLWTLLAILLVIIIAGAVLGGVLGSRAANNNNNKSTAAQSGTGSTAGGATVSDPAQISAANAAAQRGNADLPFSGSTDAYGNPMFLSTVNTATPTGNSQSANTCNDNASGLSLGNLRPHPRLMAPGYQWDCLANRINNDGYLTLYNESVMQNASAYDIVTDYAIDGGYSGSGILDVSRDIQRRVRAWAYAYRLTKDTKWVDKTYRQLVIAAGNDSSIAFGQQAPNDQHWNPVHFLDVAEMTAAYAIAYDWMYDGFSDAQRAAIRWSIIGLGLQPGLTALNNGANGWWSKDGNNDGNWNCVCNSGLILGALAIMGDDLDDSARTAKNVYDLAIANIKTGCMAAPYDDGTWPETANYWYFGTNAAARAASAVQTATGSNELITTNPNFWQTGVYHMYVSGNGGLFAYGDNGPNKFSTNANGMLFWGQQYQQPQLTLFQRDRADAFGDPLALFWYDSSAKGAFWNGLALDKFFSDQRGQWATMRSSWTDFNGMYVAIKASNLTGHQTHGDLDVGDFVLDAMGVRWAGEYGSAQYLSTNYFSNETQASERWEYFRKGTQGQNTIVVDKTNQLVTALPSNQFFTNNVSQSGSLNFKPATTDVAAFVTDMSSAYGAQSGSVQRGIRFLNGRRQVLLQDEIAASVGQSSIEWRIQTNASVSISGQTATLTINDIRDPNAAIGLDVKIPSRQLKVQLLSPSGASFTTTSGDTRLYGSDPDANGNPVGDPSNAGVTTLIIQLQPGSAQTIQTLWQPQWSDLTDADNATPKNIPLSGWNLTSHN